MEAIPGASVGAIVSGEGVTRGDSVAVGKAVAVGPIAALSPFEVHAETVRIAVRPMAVAD